MHLKLATPEKLILDESVDSVTLPGIKGEMTILPGHAMFVSQLAQGGMHYMKLASDGKEQITSLKIGLGFVEVQKDNVTVLTQTVSR